MRVFRFFTRALPPAVLFAAVLALALPGCDSDDRPILRICDPLDLVVLIDTSGSMDDEAAALCSNLDVISSQLRLDGINLLMTVMGITENSGNDPAAYSCIGGNVADVLGTAVPGGDVLDAPEDWGPAVAVVAARFPWTAGRIRVVVPMSDEAPQDGDPCEDPGADRLALNNAVATANANDVSVSPITGTGAGECVRGLAIDLAADTGGEHRRSLAPAQDLAETMIAAARATCSRGPWPPFQ